MARGKKTGGRKKGSKNIVTSTLKSELIKTVTRAQRDPKWNMWEWMKLNPNDFWRLAGKLIPTEITADIKGDFMKVIKGIDQRKL